MSDIEDLRRLIEQEKSEKKSEVSKRNKRYREEHPGYARARLVQWQRARKEKMIELKGGKCADCGGVFPPYGYDFHHIDGRDRSMPRMNKLKWKEILVELDKCVLLCAICHRGRHVTSDEELIYNKKEIPLYMDDPFPF
jgi:hypothetical protein